MLQSFEVFYWSCDPGFQLVAPSDKGRHWRTVVVGEQIIAHSSEFHLLVVNGFADCHFIVQHAYYFRVTLGELLLDLWSIQDTAHDANELMITNMLQFMT